MKETDFFLSRLLTPGRNPGPAARCSSVLTLSYVSGGVWVSITKKSLDLAEEPPSRGSSKGAPEDRIRERGVGGARRVQARISAPHTRSRHAAQSSGERI